MATCITVFTSEIALSEMLNGAEECGPIDNPWAVVDARGPRLSLSIHVDDTESARKLAAAIIEACVNTETVRAHVAVEAEAEQLATDAAKVDDAPVGAIAAGPDLPF